MTGPVSTKPYDLQAMWEALVEGGVIVVYVTDEGEPRWRSWTMDPQPMSGHVNLNEVERWANLTRVAGYMVFDPVTAIDYSP